MFIFQRCFNSLAVVIPVKYEYDRYDLIGSLVRSEYSEWLYVVKILVKPAMCWGHPWLVSEAGPHRLLVMWFWPRWGEKGTDGVSEGWYQAALCSAGDSLRGINSMMPGELVQHWFRWLVTSWATIYPTFPWKKAFPLLVFWLWRFIKLHFPYHINSLSPGRCDKILQSKTLYSNSSATSHAFIGKLSCMGCHRTFTFGSSCGWAPSGNML